MYYPENIIRELSNIVDYWIVDIKSTDKKTFESYTGKTYISPLKQLETLNQNVKEEDVTIKVPIIPYFNNEDKAKHSKKEIQKTSFHQVEIVNYIIQNQRN